MILQFLAAAVGKTVDTTAFTEEGETVEGSRSEMIPGGRNISSISCGN